MRTVAAVLAVALLLGGCSAAEPEQEFPRVTSFRSPAEASAPPSDRPLVPVDATDDERAAFQETWMACIRKVGGAKYQDPRDLKRFLADKDKNADKVRVACQSKEPETYEERQKRTDVAAFRDNQRQWRECARKAGYKLTAADENGEFGITEVGPNGDFQSEKMENCRKEAFKE